MIGDDVKDFLSGHFIDDDMGIVEKQVLNPFTLT